MNPVERHRRATRWDDLADRLPATDPRAKALRALAREQRNRASLAQHGEPNDPVKLKASPLVPGTSPSVRVRRGRIGARAA